MRQKASLYVRFGTKYEPVEFKKGQPQSPANYIGKFYVRFSDSGKRYWKSFDDLQLAQVFRRNLTTDIDRRREGLPPVRTDVNNLLRDFETGLAPEKGTIAEAVAAFIAECESRIQDWRNGGRNGLSPNSVTAYKRAVNNFATSCAEFGAVQMSEFSVPERGAAILTNHKAWLQKNTERRHGKAAYSDSRQFVVLNQFLAGHGIKLAKDRTVNPNDIGLLKRHAVPSVAKPKKGDVVFYTPEDIKAMLSAALTVDYKHNNNVSWYDADDLRDLLLVFLWTGCRDEEIQHLEWSDFIARNGDGHGKIIIQDKPQYDWRVKDHEKREIRLKDCPQLRDLLVARQKRMATDAWQKTHQGHSKTLIFSTANGTPDQNFADRIGAMQERAELGEVKRKAGAPRKPYTFSRPEARRHILHNFRKTWATWQSVKGIPAQNIQAALGHSELSTTERYLSLVDEPEKTRAAFDAISA
jgi:integrase